MSPKIQMETGLWILISTYFAFSGWTQSVTSSLNKKMLKVLWILARRNWAMTFKNSCLERDRNRKMWLHIDWCADIQETSDLEIRGNNNSQNRILEKTGFSSQFCVLLRKPPLWKGKAEGFTLKTLPLIYPGNCFYSLFLVHGYFICILFRNNFIPH